MGLIYRTIPGLYNGVSQQPPALRLESQCELQENAMSEVVDGLVKRPNTEHIASLESKADHDSLLHPINRDTTERYKVIFTGDPIEPIEVFTIDGVKCTVLYEGSTKDYVTESNPKESFRAVTIADHTIIVNRNKVVKLKAASGSIPNPIRVGYVKRGYPEITYTIKVRASDGTELASVSYTTPAPSSNGVTTSQTDSIATHLANELSGTLGTTDWAIGTLGSSVVLENTAGNDFTLECSDSYGDTALVAINGSVQKFTDLPPIAPDGYRIVIEGDVDSKFDNFYVQYRADKNVWEETVALSDSEGSLLQNELDPATMPHRLVRSDVNEFTLKQIDWEPRKVGDLESAPAPSFVDNTIKDVYFFKNRLGFLSGENVIMSRAAEYFNFFPSTATDILDSDPIDVAVSTTRVAVLEHAVPFSSSLLLFSDQQQFVAGARQRMVTPSTFAVDPSTYFEASKKCAPVGAGPNIYFVVPSGKYSCIREYYVQPETLTNDAADVTAHVPRYLPPNITKLASSSAEDILFAISPDEPHNVYVYRYYWENEKKAQSAWFKWVFDDEVLDIEVLDNYLYIVTKNGEERDLVRMSLDPSANTGDLDFRVHLDKLVELHGVYNSTTDTTTWTLPYQDTSNKFMVVNSRTGNLVTETEHPTPNTITVSGDYSTDTHYIGKVYTERYIFSQLYPKDRNGLSEIQGKLKVRTMTLSYVDTGEFDFIVRTPGREPQVYEFTGIIIGVSKLGAPSIVSGEKTFGVSADAKEVEIEIRSESYLPCKIQIAAYEANYTSRAEQY